MLGYHPVASRERLPKDKYCLKVESRIESSLEQHREVLKRLGVEPITASIFK